MYYYQGWRTLNLNSAEKDSAAQYARVIKKSIFLHGNRGLEYIYFGIRAANGNNLALKINIFGISTRLHQDYIIVDGGINSLLGVELVNVVVSLLDEHPEGVNVL